MLITYPALGVMAFSVTEDVDFATLDKQTAIVTFELQPSATAALTDADLKTRCTIAAPASDCQPWRDITTGRIIFTVIDKPDFGVEELIWEDIWGEAGIRVRLSHEYRSRQFSLAPGLLAEERELSIRYPAYSAIVGNVRDQPTLSTFTVSGKDNPLDIPSSVTELARSLVIGDAFNIPRLQGSLCIVAIMQPGETSPALSALSPDCEPFVLPTTGLLVEESAELVLVAIDTWGDVPRISSARTPLMATSAQLTVSVNVASTMVTGTSFDVDISVDGEVDRCEVTVLDLEGDRWDELDLTTCDSVRLGTAGLVSGDYLIRVRATHGELTGTSTATFTFADTGEGAVEITTDKDVYSAGESLAVFPAGEGELCEVTVTDSDGNVVTRTSSGGCEPADLELEEELEPGMYEVEMEVYQGGEIVATGVKTVEIVDWRPRQGSVHSDLCFGGTLPVLDTGIPCIGPRMVCHPTSADFPLCLCFDENGMPRDVCEYQDTCLPMPGSATACSSPSASTSPFTVVRTRGTCVAKRGLETLTCVEVGEICSGTCVCLDPSDQALSPCTAGQVCTLAGCQHPEFTFEVKEFKPIHVRTDDMIDGVSLTWTGVVKMGDRVDDKRVREELEASSFLGGTGGPPPGKSYDDALNEWTFSTAFNHSLSPGRYDAFLMLSVGDDMHLVRRPFEVWYPLEQSEIGIEVISVAPRRISRAAVEHGATVRLGMRITDTESAEVPYVPVSAMTAHLGGGERSVRADVTSATYDRHTGTWTVVMYIQGDSTDTDHLTFAVNHLGRTGQARAQFDVLEHVPLSIRILSVEPGTRERPLFMLLAGLGFDMDVLMDLEGGEIINKDSFSVRVGPHDVSEMVAFVYRTSVGVRLHLSAIRLCPTPEQAMPLDVVVTVRDTTGDEVSDTSRIQLSGNPGNWRNLEGVVC